MKEDDNYELFGKEWKDELMKNPKIMIISLYRSVCLELQELKDAYKHACEAVGEQEKRAIEAEREIRQILNDIER